MISIVFDKERDKKEGYINCCRMIIDDHGIKQEKNISVETLIDILNSSKCNEKKTIQLGKMPRGYLATKQMVENYPKITSKTAIFLKEDIHRITYEDQVYEIPIPNIMMIHNVSENGCVGTSLYCLSQDMDQERAATFLEDNKVPTLYYWPFSNVSDDGHVCYGGNNIRKIEKLSDLDILPILFFDSAINNDYYTSRRTTLEKKTVRELLDTLNGKSEFPYEILRKMDVEPREVF